MTARLAIYGSGHVAITSRLQGYKFVAQFPNLRQAISTLCAARFFTEEFELRIGTSKVLPNTGLYAELRDGVTAVQLEAAGFRKIY